MEMEVDELGHVKSDSEILASGFRLQALGFGFDSTAALILSERSKADLAELCTSCGLFCSNKQRGAAEAAPRSSPKPRA
jgi:hypothetical protein